MFINKLNQLYKPKRLLYYVDATEEDVKAFRDGKIPENVAKYQGAFATYDYAGVFYLKSSETAVIGIEYRPGDDRVPARP